MPLVTTYSEVYLINIKINIFILNAAFWTIFV